KLWYHLVFRKVAKIAPIGGRRILGLLLGELREVGALLQICQNCLSLVFGLDQNMTSPYLLLIPHLLDGVVVDLAHGLVADITLRNLAQQQPCQQLGTHGSEAALEVVAAAQSLFLSGATEQDHVDQMGNQIIASRFGSGVLRQTRADLLLSERKVALVDLYAIDFGDNRIARWGLRHDDG